MCFSRQANRKRRSGVLTLLWLLAALVVLLAPFGNAIAQVIVKRWGQGVHALELTSYRSDAHDLVVDAGIGVTGGSYSVSIRPS